MRILIVWITLVMLASCKKQITSADDYLEVVKRNLQDSLSKTRFEELNFAHAILNRVDSANLIFLRVPASAPYNFLLTATDRAGQVKVVRWIRLMRQMTNTRTWNGSTTMASSDERRIVQSPVVDGYVTAFHSDFGAQKSTILRDPYQDLPEVV